MIGLSSALARLAVFAAALALVFPLALGVAHGLRAPQPVSAAVRYDPGVATEPPSPDAAPHASPPPTLPDASAPAERPGNQKTGQHQRRRPAAISQFDGGPLAHGNCTMAAGAMLAIEAFGIETTGSALRALQDDQAGGTDLSDLATALWRGWHSRIRWGAISTLRLQRLLGTGRGVVVQGDYGQLPASLRLQPSFSGDHAVYVVAYHPGDERTLRAYFVIDPIGRGRYTGEWWPAEAFEQFAWAFAGNERVHAAWAPALSGLGPQT